MDQRFMFVLVLSLGAASAVARGTPESLKELEAALTRVDAGGGVTVTAVYMTPDYLKAIGRSDLELGPDGDTLLVFRLTLDTHAGDLLEYDLTRQAVLRLGAEGPMASADWKDDVTGTHHRSGYLRFPGGAPNGQDQVELVLRDVGGVSERLIHW